MKALINTKSNYRNLNGHWLTIKDFLGDIVACKVFDSELGRVITVDFNIKEIKEIKN